MTAFKNELNEAIGILGRLLTRYGALTEGYDEVRAFFKKVGYDPAFANKEAEIFNWVRNEENLQVGAVYFPKDESDLPIYIKTCDGAMLNYEVLDGSGSGTIAKRLLFRDFIYLSSTLRRDAIRCDLNHDTEVEILDFHGARVLYMEISGVNPSPEALTMEIRKFVEAYPTYLKQVDDL